MMLAGSEQMSPDPGLHGLETYGTIFSIFPGALESSSSLVACKCVIAKIDVA